jgi:signal transduction histidine kinase
MNNMVSTPAPAGSFSLAEGDFPDCEALRARDKRLAALKALMAHLIHDFNNLIVPTAGYATLLREHLQAGTPCRPYADKLQNAVEKTETYIGSVLQATHPQRRFSPRPTDLTGLLQRLLDGWMKALPVSEQITVRTELIPCRLSLDEAQWSQLIQHVFSNARDALEEGGTMTVALRFRNLTEQQAAGLDLNETQVYQVVIEDTGTGMSADILEQACDPFFTTRTCAQAAGLGLTLVHSVVQLHGGQLSIDSSEGLGTRVSLWLPANAA